jgi:hypothetical protein
MPGLTTLQKYVRKQTAVLWANPVNDGYGGRAFDAGIEIKCRWSDRQELFIDTTGEEQLALAVIHPDRDLVVGAWIAQGTLTALTADQIADPFLVDSAYEVRAISKAADLQGRDFACKAWLGRGGFAGGRS